MRRFLNRLAFPRNRRLNARVGGMVMDNNLKLGFVGGGCLIVGLVLGSALSSGGSAPPKDPAPAASLADLEASLAENAPPLTPASAPAPAAPPTDWRVSERTDPMTDETIKTACATSSNSVYLDAPYGPRGAQLCVRQHPKFGRDVYLSLDGSGQILCRSYDGCSVGVRFDDGSVQSFSANGPSDNSTETIFISNESRFITAAKAASRIRVQLEFYQNGAQTFDFPAKGLEW
jgi:hypothetical protein